MADYDTQGRKEIVEAVVIAALTALATQLVTWGIERVKAAAKERDRNDGD